MIYIISSIKHHRISLFLKALVFITVLKKAHNSHKKASFITHQTSLNVLF